MAAIKEAPRVAERTNELGIQMLSSTLHRQVFPNADPSRKPTSDQVKLSKKVLQKANLLDKIQTPLGEIDLDMPKLAGRDIQQHFVVLGLEQSRPYLEYAERFAAESLPPMPKRWSQKPGWTRYGNDTYEEGVAVAYPYGDAMVFDVEVMWKISKYPVIAVAATSTDWFSWTSPDLLKKHSNNDSSDDERGPFKTLIPMGGHSTDRVIIGHNVSYDRSRIKEEYAIEPTRFAFLDTMSLHCAIGGLSSQQRPAWNKFKRYRETGIKKARSMFEQNGEGMDVNFMSEQWLDVGAMNSLKELLEYYTGDILDKSARDTFGSENPQEVLDDFDNLMTYCAKDVHATHLVFSKVFGRFLKKCPHPVSFAGMLHMGKGYLTVSEDWKKYIAKSEAKSDEYQQTIENTLLALAEEALKKVDDPTRDDDLWLRNLDWTVAPIKMSKPRINKKGVVLVESRPIIRQRILPGKPAWYRELWEGDEERIKLTLTKRVTPYLLKLQWKGFPLYHCAAYGWTFVVPIEQADSMAKLKPLEFSANPDDETYDARASVDTGHLYYRIPHKDGDDLNVGSPLGKPFIPYMEAGTLSSYITTAKALLNMNASCSYWLGSRDRISSQFVVWKNDTVGMGIADGVNDKASGVILPLSVVMGTVTRRAVERTWMTASNAKKNRVGSELKMQIQSPDGYKIVGADVDSQELWISSLLGDRQFQMHGATPLGFMTLQGLKSLGSDLHSLTGRILGISRDNAKVFNYSRIYGAGLHHATQLLMQYNPDMTKEQARARAQNLYRATKGTQYSFKGPPYYRDFWFGGTESFMFNELERIAKSEFPLTPVLGCEIPDALRPETVRNDFMPSRINWAVQSSGVDYLHLLLVSMDYLMRRMDISGRFMISIHDEVRFLVLEEHQYLAAYALQVANMWTRAIFSSRVGIDDLPLNVAFFSAIDIDHCMRKEVDMDGITPSNDTPIPKGESVTIYQLVDKLAMTNLPDVLGDELESVALIRDQIVKETTSPFYKPVVKSSPSWWLESQMAASIKDVGEMKKELIRMHKSGIECRVGMVTTA
ncbi:DNA-directed DNA polymerase [Synchytrium microbalum]|uniref:Mitochondrial DNA polymerase catalytic subunit n=1 Tax=Synchytrium microbalum TaxID=1806994 RepID=A0A507BU58_9FUNG|nr:DNA-directed DNA polymerase [Synchytrium microbalum]TPX33040.1 DNA-directed DNA polymerase [Synchytrium microbalum]